MYRQTRLRRSPTVTMPAAALAASETDRNDVSAPMHQSHLEAISRTLKIARGICVVRAWTRHAHAEPTVPTLCPADRAR